MRWLLCSLCCIGVVFVACGEDRPKAADYDSGAISDASLDALGGDGGVIVIGADGGACPIPPDQTFPSCGFHPNEQFADGGAGRKNCLVMRGLRFCRGCPEDGGPQFCPHECDPATEYVIGCSVAGSAPSACRTIDGNSPDYLTYCCPCL